MRHDAEFATGPVWAQAARDPRITPRGSSPAPVPFRRTASTAERRQRRDVAVGPRPERPEFVRVLAESIPAYRERLAVPPGVTGLAQLNLPPDSDLNSVRRKLSLDCEYIRQAGPWLDTRLFLCTALRMIKLPERWLMPFFHPKKPSPTSNLPDAAGCTGGNGHGNGSDHASATPVNVQLTRASATATATDTTARTAGSSRSCRASVNRLDCAGRRKGRPCFRNRSKGR